MFILAILSVLAILYAFGWVPDFKVLWDTVIAGGRTLITAPLTDFCAMAKRLALVAASLLILALALPAQAPVVQPSNTGTYADLKQAIEVYQSAHGLKPDGVWGARTNKMYISGR